MAYLSDEYDFEVSECEAIRELKKHGIIATARTVGADRQIVAAPCGGDEIEIVATRDDDGDYYAGDIMAWLGY